MIERIQYEEYKEKLWTWIADSWLDLAATIASHRPDGEAQEAIQSASVARAQAAAWHSAPRSGSTVRWGEAEERFWDFSRQNKFI